MVSSWAEAAQAMVAEAAVFIDENPDAPLDDIRIRARHEIAFTYALVSIAVSLDRIAGRAS